MRTSALLVSAVIVALAGCTSAPEETPATTRPLERESATGLESMPALSPELDILPEATVFVAELNGAQVAVPVRRADELDSVAESLEGTGIPPGAGVLVTFDAPRTDAVALGQHDVLFIGSSGAVVGVASEKDCGDPCERQAPTAYQQVLILPAGWLTSTGLEQPLKVLVPDA